MKKILLYTLMTVAAAGMTACEDFLTRDTYDQIGSDEFWKSETDLELYANGFLQKMIPGDGTITRGDIDADYCAVDIATDLLRPDGNVSPDNQGGWTESSWTNLRRLNLVDRDGKVTPYRIPRLKDVLEWGKDKVVFNFDNKYINTKGVSDEVRRASLDYYIRQLRPGGEWSMYHNIMLSVRSIEEALYYWNHGIRNVMFCVEISSMEHFRAYEASPIPWKYIMAYIRLAVNPELQQVYDLLHAEGVMTMTSITGSSDKVKNPHDRRVAYMRELLAEPDIIETDYPSEFIGLPWSRDAIHALQDAAIRGNRSSTDLK